MATAKVWHRPTCSSPSGRGPQSSPVVPSHLLRRRAASPPAPHGGHDVDYYCDDGQRYCRHCPSRVPLYTDWAQGDVVCTQCGIVADERLLDAAPEWRDFHDADDLAKGRPNMSRSGLVAVDESLYVGGLQPTTLSRGLYLGSNFGNAGRGNNSKQSATSSASGSSIRARLAAAARRVDRRMERASREAIEAVKLSQQILQRKRKRRRTALEGEGDHDHDDHDDEDSVGAPDSDSHLRPEYERLVLQEEDDTNRRKEALYADKWSLARAIRRCGTSNEVSMLVAASDDYDANPSGGGGGDDDDDERLDSTLQQASHDLYRVYSMLLQASADLHLPERVRGDAVELLCRYASRRDGLGVRGVSSATSSSSSSSSFASAGLTATRPGLTTKSPRQEREARKALADYNKIKQAGALCSALLFYSSRRTGHARPMEEVCASVRPAAADFDNPHLKAELEVSAGFILKKHCSKAMKEVKDLFPEVAMVNPTTVTPPLPSVHPETSSGAATLANVDALSNSVDHKLRGLHLPPVAQAAIRSLVVLLATEASGSPNATGDADAATVAAQELSSPKSLPTLCGAVAVLVCHAGAVMQRLAAQARSPPPPPHPSAASREGRKRPIAGSSAPSSPGSGPSPASSPGLVAPSATASASAFQNFEDEALGDGFDDDGGDGGDGARLSSEQRAYEMGRIWDAWCTQTPWGRSVPDIEQSVRAPRGGPSSSVLQFYRRHVFPRRHSLLRRIGDAVSGRGAATPTTTTSASDAAATAAGVASTDAVVASLLREAPLATVLLPQIPLVASMLNEDARTDR